MKRLFLSVTFAVAGLTAEAQVPVVSEAVCAYCEARTTKGESHKPGCPYYEEEVEEPQNTQNDTPPQEPVRYVDDATNVGLGEGRICPECGKTSHTASTCELGRLQYSYFYWHNLMVIGDRKERKTAEEKANEIRAKLEKRYKEATERNKPSTKLRDYEPIRDQQPAEPLRPQMNRMARPDLPNSIRLVSVQETSGPNDPTIYDKLIEFKGDEYGIQAVARGRTSQDGKEEWTLFKKDGTKLAGPFCQLYVTDTYNCDCFVTCDMDGQWGIYDKYGRCQVQNNYSAIKPARFSANEGSIVFTRFVCERNGKWGMIDVSFDETSLPFEYDYIGEWDSDPELGLVEKNGRRGLVHFDGRFQIPAEYTYIEQVNIQKAGKYYIVSKDGVNYGAYRDQFLEFPLESTLGEIRQKVNDHAAAYIKQKEKAARKRGR